MRFRIGLLLSLFGGVIGIGLFRELIKSMCPALDDKTLDIVSLLILLIGLIISELNILSNQKINRNYRMSKKEELLNLFKRKIS
jgi:ABC-type antimicrobial peptide transport system permease subunit